MSRVPSDNAGVDEPRSMGQSTTVLGLPSSKLTPCISELPDPDQIQLDNIVNYVFQYEDSTHARPASYLYYRHLITASTEKSL